MKVTLYKGVDSIKPGKNIVLFCGQFLDQMVHSPGKLEPEHYSSGDIGKTLLGYGTKLNVLSAYPDKRKHQIHFTMVDKDGNKQFMEFDLRHCGKGTVFGHHRRLTVELQEFPNGEHKGKAVSAFTGESVPFKGALGKKKIGGLLYDWLDGFLSDVGPVFFNPEKVLDILARETALEDMTHTPLRMEERIPLGWNPCSSFSSLPAKIREARDAYQLSNYSTFKRLNYEEAIGNALKAREDAVTLEQLLDAHAIPCYPLFRINPHGPGVWDEDKIVRFIGIYQKGGAGRVNVSNYSLCERIKQSTGIACTPDELYAACKECCDYVSPPRDTYIATKVSGCTLYFLGTTEVIRKERVKCASCSNG